MFRCVIILFGAEVAEGISEHGQSSAYEDALSKLDAISLQAYLYYKDAPATCQVEYYEED